MIRIGATVFDPRKNLIDSVNRIPLAVTDNAARRYPAGVRHGKPYRPGSLTVHSVEFVYGLSPDLLELPLSQLHRPNLLALR